MSAEGLKRDFMRSKFKKGDFERDRKETYGFDRWERVFPLAASNVFQEDDPVIGNVQLSR